MSMKKLVEKGFEDRDYDTLTVETEYADIELPALEGRLILKAFADELMEHLDAEYRDKGEKMNATAQIIQNSDLLSDEEEQEVLNHNQRYKGSSDSLSDAGTMLYKALSKFFEEREKRRCL